jgi:hypothetical protein
MPSAAYIKIIAIGSDGRQGDPRPHHGHSRGSELPQAFASSLDLISEG